MQERELKFYVPEGSRDAVYQALCELNATESSLHACYFDTPGYDLASHRIALRVRQEDDQWVQTVKTPGQDEVSRVEISHPRPDATLELSVYDRTKIGRILRRHRKSLGVRYETQINRLAVVANTDSGAIELAYDRGVIVANGFEIPVVELEFELISGDANDLFTMSETWVKKYGLVLDLRSKAERGDRLAHAVQGEAPSSSGIRPLLPEMVRELAKPRHACPVALTPSMSGVQAYQAIVTECLNQIVRNMTFLALSTVSHVRPALVAEYVHQARIGIRRLRSCWKLFEDCVPQTHASRLDALRELFGALGHMRDGHVVIHSIEPMLVDAGMPAVDSSHEAETESRPDATTLALSVQTQTLLLGLLKDMVGLADAESRSTDTRPIRKRLRRRLDRWLKNISYRGVRFQQLSIDEQHDLRKKVKRLRYGLEFSQDVLPKSRLRRVRRSLEYVQDTVGELNDFYVAEAAYRKHTEIQPQAWFAIGWLKAKQERQRALAQEAFTSLDNAGSLKK